MKHSNWRLRAFALLQLILALPLVLSGSLCFSTDGSVRPEFGVCDCAVPVAGTSEASIGAADTPDCGPCRDEAFSAMRSARPAAPDAPMPSSFHAALCQIVAAVPVLGPRANELSQPPGERLPILRC